MLGASKNSKKNGEEKPKNPMDRERASKFEKEKKAEDQLKLSSSVHTNSKEKLAENDGKANAQKKVLLKLTNVEIEEHLKHLPYYHGFLLHEYQTMLLTNYGDFVLRVSVKGPEETGKKKPSGTKVKPDKEKSKEPEPNGKPQDSNEMAGKEKLKFSLVVGVYVAKKADNSSDKYSSAYDNLDDTKARLDIIDVPLRVEVGNDGKWNGFYIERKKKFPTIAECLTYYRQYSGTYKDKKFNLMRGVPLTSWELDRQNVEITSKKLGEGAFGEVRVGRIKNMPPAPVSNNNNVPTPPTLGGGGGLGSEQKKEEEVVDNEKVAIKLLKNEDSKSCVKEMMHEARLQLCMKNKNVIRTIGVCILQSPLFIVTEFCENGSMKDYLEKNKCDGEEKLRFAYGAGRGVEYLHRKTLIHRDLATRNILVTANKTPKIADFGLTRYGTSYTMNSKQKVPLRYLAPETIIGYKFSQKTDVYTFGLVLWEIYENGKEPYRKVQDHQKEVVTTGEDVQTQHFLEIIKKELWIKFNAEAPAILQKFVADRIFLTDEHKRTTMADTVQMIRNAFKAMCKDDRISII